MDKQIMYDFIAGNAAKCRLLVVGDVMLDKYYYGEVTRISPEAPVPVTRVTSQKETLGGAANVAHNLARLECQIGIAGFVGDDYHCQSLTDKFTARGIDYKGLITTDRPTTTKLRVIGGHQQMLRLDFEEAEDVEGAFADRLHNFVAARLQEGVDAVIISDYGKGACTEATCQMIIKAANAQKVPVLVDPKGTDWEKYRGADYITPNFKELSAVLPTKIKNQDEDIEKAARFVMDKFGIKQVLATRSEHGMSLVMKDGVIHIPTKAQEVFDVSGAGDTVIGVFALGLAGGLEPEVSAYMSNMAASVVVAKLGTYAVSKEELLEVLK
ncbi:putative D-beta-D-heptose 7-phosphate kinase [Selenomonas ruminantium subsp. lactilytica TAM6421]|uniref:Putative D-beta-D-heptose 7-phosphate kinase n=1 Tax=Selenomonas ruminantium subsp. lactilytica (strain NBRC 103574 / TAM6421) TaxID=927704 RepID=I0GUC7_SELRL|nr:D-glycero-beta-D-manno-heptose-7-phosphate kinase [Selenomonas ruminantium]BAL84364.1 putative D-beta-D-heptose 7-phosphate kinase [Selenomonas ruminantium subsp. lactilytica TAM6421]